VSSVDRLRSSAAAVPPLVCLSAVEYRATTWSCRAERPSSATCLSSAAVRRRLPRGSCRRWSTPGRLLLPSVITRHVLTVAANRRGSTCASSVVIRRRPPRVRLLLWSDAARHVVPAAADRVRGDFCCCPTSRTTWSPAATGWRLSSSRVVAVRRRSPPVYRQDVATVGYVNTFVPVSANLPLPLDPWNLKY